MLLIGVISAGSEGEYLAAALFVAGGVATVSGAALMLRRTKIKGGFLEWGPLAALLTVMGFVCFVGGTVAFEPARDTGYPFEDEEYQNIICAVGTMMIDNRLTSLPNPSALTSGNGMG
jgi:hypothetical protein